MKISFLLLLASPCVLLSPTIASPYDDLYSYPVSSVSYDAYPSSLSSLQSNQFAAYSPYVTTYEYVEIPPTSPTDDPTVPRTDPNTRPPTRPVPTIPPTHPYPIPSDRRLPVTTNPLQTRLQPQPQQQQEVTLEEVRQLLDQGAAYPRQPLLAWQSSSSQQPHPHNLTHFAWVSRAIKNDVCSIPSSRSNITRTSALRQLANSIVSAMSLSSDPCTNFYEFACGGWTARWNESRIPPQEASWSKSFSEINKRNERIMKEVLECARLRVSQLAGLDYRKLNISLPVASSASTSLNSSKPPSSHNDTEVDVNEEEWVSDPTDALLPTEYPPSFTSLPSIDRQLGLFYGACMNREAIDARGLEAIEPILNLLAQPKNLQEWMRMLGRLTSEYQLSLLFSFGIGVNPHDPSRYMISFSQGGIPFSTQELLIGPNNVTQAYREHTERMLGLAGESTSEAARKAKAIVDLQVAIAKLHWTPEELRIPEKQDNPMTIKEFSKLTHLDFLGYLRNAMKNQSLSGDLMINIAQPSHFIQLGRLLHSTPLSALRDYAYFMTLHSYHSALPQEFSIEHYQFFEKLLAGVPQQTKRSRVCQAKAIGLMADAMSQKYVDVAFTSETEALVRKMLLNIQLTFLQRLPKLQWMANEDKLAAANKLTGMIILIGATRKEKQLNYTDVVLRPRKHFENVLALMQYSYNDTLSRFFSRVDRERFQMPASQVNAYYDPTLNSMNFPAGIIQPDFFSEYYPKQWNYAALGSVMGHELTHGFDDEGRKFDRYGALNPWWSNLTALGFANATLCLVQQYSEYQLMPILDPNSTLPTPHIRGNLTLGENIADQGGITLSHQALENELKEEKMKRELQRMYYEGDIRLNRSQSVDLISPPSRTDTDQQSTAFEMLQEMNDALKQFDEQQLFFIGYAQSWCRVVRPSSFRRTLLSDPHSPSEARVNIPLMNFPPFARAFQCSALLEKMNDPTSTQAKCKVW